MSEDRNADLIKRVLGHVPARLMSDPKITTNWHELDQVLDAAREEGRAEGRAEAWPDTFTLMPPRFEGGYNEPHPVLGVLSTQGHNIQHLAHALREVGHPVPRRMEAELAVGFHWLLGFALRHGRDWQQAAGAALAEMAKAHKTPYGSEGDRFVGMTLIEVARQTLRESS